MELLVTLNLNQVVCLDCRVAARLCFSGGTRAVGASPGFLPQIADMPLTAVSLSSLPVISYSSFHHPPTPVLPLGHIICHVAFQQSAFAAEVFTSKMFVVVTLENHKCGILDDLFLFEKNPLCIF